MGLAWTDLFEPKNNACHLGNGCGVCVSPVASSGFPESVTSANARLVNKQKLCVLVDLYWADATICIAKM